MKSMIPLWTHQEKIFERSKDAPAWALLMEQRTGKSRIAVMTAEHLFCKGEIDAVAVVAPLGVDVNWTLDEFPKWATAPFASFNWRVKRVGKEFLRRFEEFLSIRDRLPVFTMNVDALITEEGKKSLKRFLSQRRVLYILDESDVICNPGAKRTKTALASSKYAPYRRILTGTPVAESPFDAYAQFKFLDPAILGFSEFSSFKARYADIGVTGDRAFREVHDRVYAREIAAGRQPPVAEGIAITEAARIGKTWDEVKEYRNLEELSLKIGAFSSRVLRSEVSDAPAKIYAKARFQLTPRQRAFYDELRDKFIAELSSEEVVSTSNVLARYTRLQQVTSNLAVLDRVAQECPRCVGTDPECVACDGIGLVVPERIEKRIDETNPRLLSLGEELRRNRLSSSIVWCKFNVDVDDVIGLLEKMGRRPVRYDGRISDEEKLRSKRAFQEGLATDIVGKTSSGGRGLDFSRTEGIHFYNCAFPLRWRLQGEDRGESLLKRFATIVTDHIAEDSIDDKIVEALRNKRQVSSLVTGDRVEDWI